MEKNGFDEKNHFHSYTLVAGFVPQQLQAGIIWGRTGHRTGEDSEKCQENK
jgi:hypothetical protein